MKQENDFLDSVEKAAAIIRNAKKLIAFTGAGISAESGIATFRGENGIWGKYDESHLELGFFLREPETSWETIHRIFFEQASSFLPNDAHIILAEWEEKGLLDFIITQNIDGLHSSAGSKRVAEFHGSCRFLICLNCGGKIESKDLKMPPLPPRCSCGGVYKPDFVFFGEGIPGQAMKDAFAAAESADACLVIGSTGMVYPAAYIPLKVKERGFPVIEINPEASSFTENTSEIFIASGAGRAMRELNARL